MDLVAEAEAALSGILEWAKGWPASAGLMQEIAACMMLTISVRHVAAKMVGDVLTVTVYPHSAAKFDITREMASSPAVSV